MRKHIFVIGLLTAMLTACGTAEMTGTQNTAKQTQIVTEQAQENVKQAQDTEGKPQEILPDQKVPGAGAVPGAGESAFEVHYIDVGQADAALVLCDGQSMLIDGGNRDDSDLIYTYLKKLDIDYLDYIVATHAHEDHIGGLAGALNAASAGTAYSPVKEYDSKVFGSFTKYLEQQGTELTIPEAGENFSLGSAEVTVLGPVQMENVTETNNTSIVLKVEYGETSFLFTGDAEREEEQEILEAGFDVKSTVLKVGHHGGATSTSYPFLREVMPEYAVISVGEGNKYGHPTDDVLSRLRDADVQVYRTDELGDIICTSDGTQVYFHTENRAENAETEWDDNITLDDDLELEDDQMLENDLTLENDQTLESDQTPETLEYDYVLNTSSKKFHYPDCSSVSNMKEKNKENFSGSREELLEQGYAPCGNCKP